MSDVRLRPVAGIGEIAPGTDLPRLVAEIDDLADGEVVVVTSKVVSKAEGRMIDGDRDDAVAGETVRVVARRGRTRIVENRLGLVLAAAGVDSSNVPPGRLALLPVDPDASARAIRERVLTTRDRNVAVVVTDTAGRTWRNGQTDIAIGVAGLQPLDSFAGRYDGYGNQLAVTAPAVADEIAAAAELAAGKLSAQPIVVVCGLVERVLPAGDHGPGAAALQRPRASDLFALGVREAVVAALAGSDADSFGTPAADDELVAALDAVGVPARAGDDGQVDAVVADDAAATRATAIAFAHRWETGGERARPHLLRFRAAAT